MINVLHIIGSMNPGGIETWLLNILRSMDRSKIQFYFLTQSEDKGFYDDEIEALGGVVFYSKDTKNPLSLYSRVKKVVDEHDISVIHSHVYTFSFVYSVIGRMISTPVIVHSHTTRTFNTFSKKAYHTLASLVINSTATTKLACSEEAGKKLYGNTAFTIQPYGVDSNKFSPLQQDEISAEIGAKEDNFVVGHVGRFVDVKNHQFIVEIAKRLTNEKVQFICIGSGPKEQEIQSLIAQEQLNNIKLLSPRSDIYKFMGSYFDALILPSKFEGLGIVALEAQSCGIHTIVSEGVPAGTEVVDHIFHRLPIDDASKWADLIRTIEVANTEIKRSCNEQFSKSSFSLASSVKHISKIYMDASKSVDAR